MSLAGGIEFPNPLALAAVDDEALTEEMSRLMAEEARERGIAWSFTPVLDVNAAWRSPIVATRGYGSEVERIERHVLAQIRGFRAGGVGATGPAAAAGLGERADGRGGQQGQVELAPLHLGPLGLAAGPTGPGVAGRGPGAGCAGRLAARRPARLAVAVPPAPPLAPAANCKRI